MAPVTQPKRFHSLMVVGLTSELGTYWMRLRRQAPDVMVVSVWWSRLPFFVFEFGYSSILWWSVRWLLYDFARTRILASVTGTAMVLPRCRG